MPTFEDLYKLIIGANSGHIRIAHRSCKWIVSVWRMSTGQRRNYPEHILSGVGETLPAAVADAIETAKQKTE